MSTQKIDVSLSWNKALKICLALLEAGDEEGRSKAKAELYKMAALADEYANKFPNGFDSWQETNFEIVSHLVHTLSGLEDSLSMRTQAIGGQGALYELAEALTTEFETLHKGVQWDGDYFDEIDKFIKEKEEAKG